MTPASLDKAQESARQFANSVRLEKPYRLRGNQFTAYPQGYRPSDDKTGCVLLIHAPGGDQRNMREHPVQWSPIGFTADLDAGNDLDETRPRLPVPFQLVPPNPRKPSTV